MKFKLATCFQITLMAALLAAPQAARAQSRTPPTDCHPHGEAIITLHDPVFETATVWDATYGDQGDKVRFGGVVPLDNGDVMLSGDVQDAHGKPASQLLTELDPRGRPVIEKRRPVAADQRTVGLIKTGKGYITGATVFDGAQDSHVQITWFTNRDLKVQRDLALKDPAYRYELLALSPTLDGHGAIAVIHATARRDPADERGILVRLGEGGKQIWRHAYGAGVKNRIDFTAAAGRGYYVAGGSIRGEDGRMAGWLFRVNEDGTMGWQNVYPRGMTAGFHSGVKAGDDFIAGGSIAPYGKDPAAAWILRIDNGGALVWQRYLRGNGYDLDARGAQLTADGRVTIMAAATAKSEAGHNHLRLVTLAVRGALAGDEAYMEGRSAVPSALVAGPNNERIVAATIETDAGGVLGAHGKATGPISFSSAALPLKADMGPALPSDQTTMKGWVFVATPAPEWHDPCAGP